MSNSKGATGTSGGRSANADPQALVGLLENLVPLLLHFQTQAFGPAGPGRFAGGPGSHIEQQAATAFTEDVLLDALRNLSSYVQKNESRYPGLENYTSVIADARQALFAGDYQRALGLVFEAYRAIAILRAIKPELPPIRQRSDEEQQSGREQVH
jgi:hypothetical protein